MTVYDAGSVLSPHGTSSWGELRQQFKSEYAEDEARGKLRWLTQRGRVRDYCREFSELLLMIPDMSEREALFSFMDGLKLWVKTELPRRGVQVLSRAIAVAESLIEFERTESPKARLRGRSGDDDSGSSDDEAEGKAVHRRDKSDEAAKDKGQTYERKPKGCFFSDGPHRASECPVRNRLAAIVRAEEPEHECDDRHQGEPRRLGAIRVRDGHHGE